MSSIVDPQFVFRLRELTRNRREMIRMMHLLSDRAHDTRTSANYFKLGGSGGAVVGGFMALASFSGFGIPLAIGAGLTALSGTTLCGANLYDFFSSKSHQNEWNELLERDRRLAYDVMNILPQPIVNELNSGALRNLGEQALPILQFLGSAVCTSATAEEMTRQLAENNSLPPADAPAPTPPPESPPEGGASNVQSREVVAGILGIIFLPYNVYKFWTSASELLLGEKSRLAKAIEESAVALEQNVSAMERNIRQLENQFSDQAAIGALGPPMMQQY